MSSGPPTPNEPTGVRLQRVLARAGFGSRRACEELIAAGRVQVDGRTVTQQGLRVDPDRMDIRVDGVRAAPAGGNVHLALNKPRGMLSAMADPRGRPCVGDLVADRCDRLFHVGRLDADSEGLLLLTNDGDLAQRLAHPSHGVPKTYLATVRGPLRRDVGRTLRNGVSLTDGPARVDAFRAVDRTDGQVLVELVLHEGRQRLVRRLLAAVGYPVQQLVRTAVGPVRLGGLRAGALRRLTDTEVRSLYRAAEENRPADPRPHRAEPTPAHRPTGGRRPAPPVPPPPRRPTGLGEAPVRRQPNGRGHR